MAGGVRIEGLNKIVRELQKLGTELDDLKDLFGGIANDAAEIVRSKVPVQTGKLRNSVRGNRAKNKAIVSAGGKVVPYAAVINYGWPARNIQPVEFMQDADKEIRATLLPRVHSELNDLIRKHGLK